MVTGIDVFYGYVKMILRHIITGKNVGQLSVCYPRQCLGSELKLFHNNVYNVSKINAYTFLNVKALHPNLQYIFAKS